MKKSYSKIYRLLHWAIAVSFILLLITIFLRMTWMNRDNMAGIIGPFLTENGQDLPPDKVMALARKIRQPMWNWHIYLGYVLTGLFSVRFVLPFFGEMRLQNPLDKMLSTKEKFHRWTYVVFYLCVIVSLVTGLIMEFGPRDFKNPMEEIHILSLYYLIPFIIIHLTGILYAEFTDQKGLISRIVSGNNQNHT